MLGKREVFITRELDKYNQVRAALSDAGIESFARTNSLGDPGRYRGAPMIDSSAAYEYRVFVRKKDYDTAKGLLGR